MKPIPWRDLEPMEIQRIVSALLVRVLPDAHAVDGAGGDDGADVVAMVEGGVHVYEIKSFTSRLTAGQRIQVEKSLAAAMAQRSEMVAWTVVMPLDPSPAEERWLKGTLASVAGIPVAWMGVTHLEASFIEHPHIARGYLPGSAERQALEMLAEFNQAQAALASGIPDAIDRGQNLRNRMGLIDPDFEFDMDLSAGGTTIHVRPRDAQALDRRPIRGTFSVAAPSGTLQAQAIEEFTLYGAPLHLEASNIEAVTLAGLPGGLKELFEGTTPMQLTIRPGTTEPRRGRLVGLTDAKIVTRLPVTIRETSSGIDGGIRLVLTDDAGVLGIEMRVKGDGLLGEFNFSLSVAGSLPDDALPAATFIAALGGCDGARLEAADIPPVVMRLPDTHGIAGTGISDLVELLEALRRVQDECGASFAVPENMSDLERATLRLINQLVRGKPASWPWPGFVVLMPAETVKTILAMGPLPRMSVSGTGPAPVQFALAGQTLTLPGQVRMRAEQVVVTNSLVLARALAAAGMRPETPLQVRVEADARTTVAFELTREPVTADSSH